MESCENCAAALVSKRRQRGIAWDIDQLQSLLPEHGKEVERLYLSRECLLCRGEEKGERAFYAMTDVMNPAPERKKRGFLGLRTGMTKGVILTLQVACCERCKRRFTLMQYVPTVISLLIALGVLIMLSVRAIYEVFAHKLFALPLIVMLGMTAIAVIIGAIVRTLMANRFNKKTKLDVFEVEGMGALRDALWFELNTYRGTSKFVFSRERLKSGPFTGKRDYEAETIDNGQIE